MRRILWATPSAAGPRPFLIALGLQVLGIDASGYRHRCYPNLLFGILGGATLVSWESRLAFLGGFGDFALIFFGYVSRFLFLIFLGLILDVQDWEPNDFAWDVLRKSNFADFGIRMIPVHVLC